MDDIDRRIARLIGTRGVLSGSDDAGPRVPEADDGATDAATRRADLSTDPPTSNAAVGDLSFPVDATLDDAQLEARRVATRLRGLQDLESDVEAVIYGLEESLRRAHDSAPEFLRAEEQYVFSAISLLIERHLWGPRFFAESDLRFDQSQDDGSVTSVLSVINQLRATQRLPYGGDVEARWVWRATENLRSSVTGQYVQSSDLILSADIPLLRGAGQVAREDLIQAERNLVYEARSFERFRRGFLVAIAGDYFDLLQQRASIRNQACQYEAFLQLERRQQRLYDFGRTNLYEVSLARNNVNNAQSRLANQRDAYVVALDRFKIRIGLPVGKNLKLRQVAFNLPRPSVNFVDSTASALEYRLDLQNERDQLADSRRSVANARNDLLPDASLTGDVTFRTDADEDEGGLVYELDDTSYGAGLRVDLPLDREIERLNLRRSQIRLRQDLRDFDVFTDELVLEVRSRVREIDRAYFNLLNAESSVESTRRRRREQELRSDEITTQEQIDTLNDLLDAQNSRDAAVTDLRNSILDYLFSTGQMRVTRDGLFLPLPGMPETLVEADLTDDLRFDCLGLDGEQERDADDDAGVERGDDSSGD